jgi:hypothetical protein
MVRQQVFCFEPVTSTAMSSWTDTTTSWDVI